MKLLALTLALMTSQAFAFDVCSLQDTGALEDAVLAKEIKHLQTTEPFKFNQLEKKMIFEMVKKDDWNEIESEADAVLHFEDRNADELQAGTNAGEIAYYAAGSKKIAMVHYYPGDNEYGAIFEVKNGSHKMIATIGDGEISCL
jgi:hypothetical protein